MFCVNEILTHRLADTDVVTWTVASSHTWSKSCEENFLSTVHKVWQSEFGVAATDLVKVKMLHQQLRAIENPPATTSVPMKQVCVKIRCQQIYFTDCNTIQFSII